MLKGNARNPETKFINPYAMSETTTPQYDVKPEFKNGRFILKKKETMQEEKQKVDSQKNGEGVAVTDTPDVKKEPGFTRHIVDVMFEDIKKLSREERRKAKLLEQEEKEFKDFKAHRIAEDKRVYEEFLKSREAHKKAGETFVIAEEVAPKALELELLPAENISESIEDATVTIQPVHEITGDDITISTLKRTLDHWRTFTPGGKAK